MNTETRYDSPFFTADPRMSQPMMHEEEPCHDPGTCYPNDDGEADIVDPGPAPVLETASFLPTPSLQSLGARMVSAWGALMTSLRVSSLELAPQGSR